MPSRDWIRVKNRRHPAIEGVMESAAANRVAKMLAIIIGRIVSVTTII
jgi:hypothetical protein